MPKTKNYSLNASNKKPMKKAKMPLSKVVATGMKSSPAPKTNSKKKGQLKKMKGC